MRRVLLALLLLAGTTPVSAEWRKATTANFIVFSDGNENQLRTFITKLQRFDTFLRGRMNVPEDPSAPKLTVFLVEDEASVRRVMAARQANIAGFYEAGPYGPMAVVPRVHAENQFELDGAIVLFHEYTHHFMWQYFAAAYPVWFSEGFAEFYSTTNFDKQGHAQIGKPAYHRAYDLVLGTPLPLRRLLTSSIADLKTEEISNLYARAWLLTHYLTFAPARKGQLKTYIDAINSGKPSIEAAEGAFGDLKKLDADLARYLMQRTMNYVTSGVVTPLPAVLAIEPVEPGEAATMKERMTMMRHMTEAERSGVVASLRAAALRFPASAAAQLQLAEALHEADDDGGAERAADAALAINPKLSRAWLIKGMSEMRVFIRTHVSNVAQWKQARGYIVKANRADVDDPLPLVQYFKSYYDQGVKPPELAVTGLARAYELMPQDQSLRMNYGSFLMREGKLKEAVRVIEPVAYAPHGGALSEKARGMVERMRAAIASGKPLEMRSMESLTIGLNSDND